MFQLATDRDRQTDRQTHTHVERSTTVTLARDFRCSDHEVYSEVKWYSGTLG